MLGLGVAVDHALALGLDAIEARVCALAADLRDRLANVDGVIVRDEGVDRCGIVTFTVDGVAPLHVQHALAALRVNVWTIDATTARLDLDGRGLPALVRASVHYYNTAEELDRAVAAVREIASTVCEPPASLDSLRCPDSRDRCPLGCAPSSCRTRRYGDAMMDSSETIDAPPR